MRRFKGEEAANDSEVQNPEEERKKSPLRNISFPYLLPNFNFFS
jgi:hypothetical protein